jgi:putative tryptophan/tyrosine transport system substrate-binding protein
MIKRREFIVGLGSAAAWPLAARAQQPDRLRRIGVLMDGTETQAQSRLAAFVQGLRQLGWTEGQNLRMDVRWNNGDAGLAPTYAAQLIELMPDVILAGSTVNLTAIRQVTSIVPVVFVQVADPVGQGFVASLPRPGGNITGFINTDASMRGKWLQLLTEIAPGVKRAAIMFNLDTAPNGGSYYMSSFDAAARFLNMESVVAPVHNDTEIEAVITSLGREPKGGLVVPPDGFMVVDRAPIVLLTARHNVPAVYQTSVFARDGGLLSYGPDPLDIFRRSASYVDLILRCAKPADLPVQLPVRFEMALNAKTAKALGLIVPQSILLRADEVIE